VANEEIGTEPRVAQPYQDRAPAKGIIPFLKIGRDEFRSRGARKKLGAMNFNLMVSDQNLSRAILI
jgi:hypothetical protein